MAQTSGFFEAQWDPNLEDPYSQEQGDWDRKYLAEQFANYFSKFVGNGVFISPTNQLKVESVGGNVYVKEGYAYINGYWYNNSEDYALYVPVNYSSNVRYDSVVLALNVKDRDIKIEYKEGDTTLVRNETVYELQLATIAVAPNAVTISNSSITDKRQDEAVCGFVKGLVEVVNTNDLFEQYNSMFNEWFDEIKDQLVGDLAVRLQLEFEELNENVEKYKDDTQDIVDKYQEDVTEIAQDAKDTITEFVNNDYVISERQLVFVDKQCTIEDSKVQSTSLIDVYFTADTIDEAEECQIYVDSEPGNIVLTAAKQPTKSIKALFRVRVM